MTFIIKVKVKNIEGENRLDHSLFLSRAIVLAIAAMHLIPKLVPMDDSGLFCDLNGPNLAAGYSGASNRSYLADFPLLSNAIELPLYCKPVRNKDALSIITNLKMEINHNGR